MCVTHFNNIGGAAGICRVKICNGITGHTKTIAIGIIDLLMEPSTSLEVQDIYLYNKK